MGKAFLEGGLSEGKPVGLQEHLCSSNAEEWHGRHHRLDGLFSHHILMLV